MTQTSRPSDEITMPAMARPLPPTIPLLRLHSLWPMIENTRPSTLQKNDSTKPAIAMPDVRGACIGIAIIGGGTPYEGIGGMPAGIWPPARLVPQIEQNAAPGAIAFPHWG